MAIDEWVYWMVSVKSDGERRDLLYSELGIKNRLKELRNDYGYLPIVRIIV